MQVGSIATMDACVRQYAAATSLPLPEAAARASAAAARLLGLEGRKGSLMAGFDADLVVLDAEGQVPMTIIFFSTCGNHPASSPASRYLSQLSPERSHG